MDSTTNDSAPVTDAPSKTKRAPSKRARMRAAITAAPSMESIAVALGVDGKKTFRPWVRANIGHFGTDTAVLLKGKSRPKGSKREVPNVDRILDRFVDGKRDA